MIAHRKHVLLTGGYVAIVDARDFKRVKAAGPWRAQIRRRKDGSIWNVYAHRAGTLEKMHRFILGVTDPKVKVDHENHDGLINTRDNLRMSTHSQNCSNRRKMKAVRTSSRFKGVSWYKPYKKWRVQIEIDGRKKHLGYFINELEAARTYNVKAKELFREFALLNEVATNAG